jgi:hypothetical protein
MPDHLNTLKTKNYCFLRQVPTHRQVRVKLEYYSGRNPQESQITFLYIHSYIVQDLYRSFEIKTDEVPIYHREDSLNTLYI